MQSTHYQNHQNIIHHLFWIFMNMDITGAKETSNVVMNGHFLRLKKHSQGTEGPDASTQPTLQYTYTSK